MKIALAHPYRWPLVRRGGERYLLDLTRYLRAAGHDVDVIVLGPPEPGFRAVRDRFGLIEARTSWTDLDLFGLAAAPALSRRYDLVHALVPSAAVAAKLLGHRVVYTLLGEPTVEMLSRSGGRGALLRKAITASHRTVGFSTSAAEASRRLTGHPTGVLPPGVDLAAFVPVGPRARVPTVLHAGDLSVRRKGLDTLLRAVAALRRDGRELRLELAGPGDPSWAFAQLSTGDRERLEGGVELLGALDTARLKAAYARAWLTCLPAAEEAFGIVLVESLACGTPVIAGPGGANDIVTPGCGRIIEPGDSGALERAVANLLDGPDRVEACVAGAKSFGWAECIGPRHEDLYAELVGG